ncbi:MAG: hypothetical protein IKO83_08165 [Oscillospiraceae bacterium]|nr:hypothetical protein [Oscillospiraceae bacterium]
MKKRLLSLLSLVCLVAMLFSMTGVAHAQTAEFESTQTFLDYLDSKGIKYTYYGVDGKYEKINVGFDLDNFSSLDCVFFFKQDCEEVSLRIWNIVTASAGKNFVLSTLNELNQDYKFAKFVFDASDSTVQAEHDMYIDAGHCGRPVYDAMMILFDIVDDAEIAAKLHSLE